MNNIHHYLSKFETHINQKISIVYISKTNLNIISENTDIKCTPIKNWEYICNTNETIYSPLDNKLDIEYKRLFEGVCVIISMCDEEKTIGKIVIHSDKIAITELFTVYCDLLSMSVINFNLNKKLNNNTDIDILTKFSDETTEKMKSVINICSNKTDNEYLMQNLKYILININNFIELIKINSDIIVEDNHCIPYSIFSDIKAKIKPTLNEKNISLKIKISNSLDIPIIIDLKILTQLILIFTFELIDITPKNDTIIISYKNENDTVDVKITSSCMYEEIINNFSIRVASKMVELLNGIVNKIKSSNSGFHIIEPCKNSIEKSQVFVGNTHHLFNSV